MVNLKRVNGLRVVYYTSVVVSNLDGLTYYYQSLPFNNGKKNENFFQTDGYAQVTLTDSGAIKDNNLNHEFQNWEKIHPAKAFQEWKKSNDISIAGR